MLLPLPGQNDPRLPDKFRNYRPSNSGDGQEGPGFTWLGDRNGDRRNGDPTTSLLSAFFPGQLGALSGQLSQGFGGKPKEWRGILGQSYSDMTITPDPLGYPRTKNKGKNDDGKGDKDGDGKPDKTDGDDVHDVRDGDFNDHSATGWLGQPGMQVAQPQAMSTVQGPAMFGQQLSPQILALLRQRLMGGR